jgi:crotonobetainyl-CoA:carnitine CoA-transferase CaiB-like acyl-CoA transferase
MNSGLAPLAGVRVIDLSRVVSGPLCGRMLADLGADVVKVEPPEGDLTRNVPPFVDGVSAYYAQMNAGKRNVSVDLKAPGGSGVIARLAAGADVLIENFRPGVLARFGLDAPELLAANPRLVYCSVTGWGQDGPWRDQRAFAPLVHAATGTLELAARHRGRRPEHEVNQHADLYTAVIATSAVLAALVQRGATGQGQHLDVAMGQASVYVNEWAAVGLQPPVDDYANFDSWNHSTYPLGDGSYVALLGNPVDLFPVWVDCLGGDKELLTDPRFADRAARAAHVPDVVAAVEALTRRFAGFPALDAVLGPWMLAAPVRAVAELAGTDWAAHRGLTAEVMPGLPVPAAAWQASGSRIGVQPALSALGADNRSVLAGIGYSTAEIDALHGSGALSGQGEQPAEPRSEGSLE